MRQNLRTFRNHSERNQIEFRKASKPSDLNDFYNLLVKSYRDKHHMICQPKSLYKKLFNGSIDFQIHGAYKGSKLLAAIAVIFSPGNKTVYYSWAANGQYDSKLGLNYLLLENLIELAIAESYNCIDFGSSPSGDEKLLWFKERWGCVHTPVYYYNQINQPQVPDYNSSFSGIRQVFPFIPISILKTMIPIVVPQLV